MVDVYQFLIFIAVQSIIHTLISCQTCLDSQLLPTHNIIITNNMHTCIHMINHGTYYLEKKAKKTNKKNVHLICFNNNCRQRVISIQPITVHTNKTVVIG